MPPHGMRTLTLLMHAHIGRKYAPTLTKEPVYQWMASKTPYDLRDLANNATTINGLAGPQMQVMDGK